MQGNIGQLGKVSIHAPHAGERPLSFGPCGLPQHGINPRSPRGGATKHGVTIQDVARSFNPRSPRGGATHLFLSSRADSCNGFNPRSPRGGATGKAPDLAKAAKEFQSTLPTRGSDSKHIFYQALQTSFNPRSPRGGATAEKCICMQHFREFTEYYPLRHGDACCIAPQDCIIQAFFGAKKRCFYVRLCFALKNKGVRG